MKKTIIIALGLLAGVFAGCEDDTTYTPVITMDSAQMDAVKAAFPAGGDSRTAAIKTNLNSVKVSSTQPWCKAQILEDDGFILRISAMPNEGFENRSALVVVYGKGIEDVVIPVTQLCGTPFLNVDKSEINVIDGDLAFSLTISSNVDYILRRNGWIDDEGDNAVVVGSKTYKYKVGSIDPETFREGRIDIKVTDIPNENLSRSIPVTQTQSKLNPVITTFTPAAGIREAVITLGGEDFGTNPALVSVYFNEAKAEIISIADTEIKVSVPKVAGTDDAVETTIKLVVDAVDYPYAAKFTYNKSWYLSTVTGNGNAPFKGGTLAEGQVRARYLTVDDNGNIFANHRDNGTSDRHVVKISEAENSVVSLGGTSDLGWTPGAPEAGPGGRIYYAEDTGDGMVYYTCDPADTWLPKANNITYTDGDPGTSYMYRLMYNKADNHLYEFLGVNTAPVYKVDPATNQATTFYKLDTATQLWFYGATFSPDNSKIYISVNTATPGYGIYALDMSNPTAGYTRLNSSGATAAATTETLLDGPLAGAGFGQAWQLDFGPDGKLYVSDYTNSVIRAVDLQAGTVGTFLGVAGVKSTVDGNKTNARLNGPRGIRWNKDGTALYIADYDGARIRKWAFE